MGRGTQKKKKIVTWKRFTPQFLLIRQFFLSFSDCQDWYLPKHCMLVELHPIWTAHDLPNQQKKHPFAFQDAISLQPLVRSSDIDFLQPVRWTSSRVHVRFSILFFFSRKRSVPLRSGFLFFITWFSFTWLDSFCFLIALSGYNSLKLKEKLGGKKLKKFTHVWCFY